MVNIARLAHAWFMVRSHDSTSKAGQRCRLTLNRLEERDVPSAGSDMVPIASNYWYMTYHGSPLHVFAPGLLGTAYDSGFVEKTAGASDRSGFIPLQIGLRAEPGGGFDKIGKPRGRVLRVFGRGKRFAIRTRVFPRFAQLRIRIENGPQSGRLTVR